MLLSRQDASGAGLRERERERDGGLHLSTHTVQKQVFVYDELGHHLLTPPFLLGQRWTTIALAHDCGAANQPEQHHSAPNFLYARYL